MSNKLLETLYMFQLTTINHIYWWCEFWLNRLILSKMLPKNYLYMFAKTLLVLDRELKPIVLSNLSFQEPWNRWLCFYFAITPSLTTLLFSFWQIFLVHRGTCIELLINCIIRKYILVIVWHTPSLNFTLDLSLRSYDHQSQAQARKLM